MLSQISNVERKCDVFLISKNWAWGEIELENKKGNTTEAKKLKSQMLKEKVMFLFFKKLPCII